MFTLADLPIASRFALEDFRILPIGQIVADIPQFDPFRV